MNLTIITPIYKGDGTGASVYYQLLAQHLAPKGVKLTVISEHERSLDAGSISYKGLFPRRSSTRKIFVRDAFVYLLQNLAYLRLPELVAASQPDAVLVHSSFYNFPGLFPAMASRFIRPDTPFITDVRDPLIPPSRVPELNHYQSIVCCSKNVAQHLRRHGADAEKLVHVPVIQERICVNPSERDALLVKHGLTDTPYLFFAGLIKELKAVDLLLEAFLEHVKPKHPQLKLVLGGLIKTSNPYVLKSLKAPGVHYLGNLSRQESLALMSAAEVCVNPSANESFGRSSLEAIALGRRAVLPLNVPEFAEHCSEYIASERTPEGLAKLIFSVMDAPPPRYPIDEHLPENVIPHYRKLLFKT